MVLPLPLCGSDRPNQKKREKKNPLAVIWTESWIWSEPNSYTKETCSPKGLGEHNWREQAKVCNKKVDFVLYRAVAHHVFSPTFRGKNCCQLWQIGLWFLPWLKKHLHWQNLIPLVNLIVSVLVRKCTFIKGVYKLIFLFRWNFFYLHSTSFFVFFKWRKKSSSFLLLNVWWLCGLESWEKILVGFDKIIFHFIWCSFYFKSWLYKYSKALFLIHILKVILPLLFIGICSVLSNAFEVTENSKYLLKRVYSDFSYGT